MDEKAFEKLNIGEIGMLTIDCFGELSVHFIKPDIIERAVGVGAYLQTGAKFLYFVIAFKHNGFDIMFCQCKCCR